MKAERLRDTPEGWGLTPAEYARREKLRLRERMKKRMQRAQIRTVQTRLELPVENLSTFRLKGQDIQELGILAVVTNVVKRQNPISRYREPISVPMSLPFVSILYGQDTLSRRAGQ
jgi:hypothetical protein